MKGSDGPERDTLVPARETVYRLPHMTQAPRFTVAILFLVTVFNLMDRQILAILLEPIRRDLGASDTAMGLLTGLAFAGFHGLASLPVARLADTFSRRNLIAGALALWSALTALSGFAGSFAQLALLRVGVGIGESATGPAGHSMISDLFPAERRAAALAAVLMGAPIGVMVAFVAGGWLERAVGWRMTLVCVGLPGLALSLLAATMLHEPERGATETGPVDRAPYTLRETLAHLWGLGSFRHLVAGAALSMFGTYSLLVWGPAFLIRVHDLGTAEAGAWLGFAAGVGGAGGNLLGGVVAQRLARNDPRWLLLVPAASALLAVPFVVLFLALPPTLAPAVFFGVTLFGPAMIGPVMAVTQGLARVRMRAVAAALVTLSFNVAGVGAGPLAVGAASDLLAPSLGEESIRWALAITAPALLASAVHFALGARRLPTDLARSASTTASTARTALADPA